MKSHARNDPQSSTASSTREWSCWAWYWCQISKQLGCSLLSQCSVREGHAAFATLGWVSIFKIFSGLLRNLPLLPHSLAGTSPYPILPLAVGWWQCPPQRRAPWPIHCCPLWPAGSSESEAFSAFSQDRHWMLAVQGGILLIFFLCCFTDYLLSSHGPAVICEPSARSQQ